MRLRPQPTGFGVHRFYDAANDGIQIDRRQQRSRFPTNRRSGDDFRGPRSCSFTCWSEAASSSQLSQPAETSRRWHACHNCRWPPAAGSIHGQARPRSRGPCSAAPRAQLGQVLLGTLLGSRRWSVDAEAMVGLGKLDRALFNATLQVFMRRRTFLARRAARLAERDRTCDRSLPATASGRRRP